MYLVALIFAIFLTIYLLITYEYISMKPYGWAWGLKKKENMLNPYDMLKYSSSLSSEHNIASDVYDPMKENFVDEDYDINYAGSVRKEHMLSAENLGNIFINPFESEKNPEDVVDFGDKENYGSGIEYMGNPNKYVEPEYFQPFQRPLNNEGFEILPNFKIENFMGEYPQYTSNIMKGCPIVVESYDGAYFKMYVMTGTTKGGNLVYEYYGRTKDDARRRWRIAFPSCNFPNILN